MDTLSLLLSSRVRAGLFRLLFGTKEKEHHVRELARRIELHEASIRHELKKLRRLDLVVDRRDGNRLYYRANTANPLYPEIHRLVLKTTGLVEQFREALRDVDVEVAFVFGSIAQGDETATSDIDLMIIGNVGLRALAAHLTGVAKAVGREINPHVMSKKEYRKRLRRSDHFVDQVLRGSKLYVIGTEDDFAAMAR